MNSTKTKRKKMSQARRLIVYMEANKWQIIDWLKWDETRYCWHKYKAGLRYLELIMPNDVWGQEEMSGQASFWGWWKMEWYARELDVMFEWVDHKQRNGKYMPVEEMRRLYDKAHSPELLAAANTPLGEMMDEGFCKNVVNDLK